MPKDGLRKKVRVNRERMHEIRDTAKGDWNLKITKVIRLRLDIGTNPLKNLR